MKIFKTLLLAIAIAAPIATNASLPKFMLNELPTRDYNESEKLSKLYKEYKETTIRNYDVILYSIKLDWYNVLKNLDIDWQGESNIILSSTVDNLSEIEFDAGALLINSVQSDDADLVFTHSDNKLNIKLPTALNINDEINITIKYQYKGDNKTGFTLIPKNLSGSENVAYTMSEPRDARYWMPCNDISFDRALSEVQIKVPAGYTATSNGKLVDSLTVADTTVFRWESMNFQIPTYLMAITASKYVTYTDKYTKKDNTILPIKYYFWESLLNDPVSDRTATAFDLHGNMMAYYSNLFFEYPYEKYGIVCIPDFGGGMEHNTITTVDNGWIEYREYSGLAHELAHHWLGNYITCADWQDLWINEGGATWAEAMWNGHYSGAEAFKQELNGMKNGYINSGGEVLPPVYDLPESALFRYGLTYAKAGWVYQMLYAELGDEQFRATIHKIFENYPLTSITTQQFRDVVKEMNPDYPLSWDKFFEQWLLKPGHPKLKMSVATPKQIDNKYEITLNISQNQIAPDVPEVFEIPISVEFVKDNGDTLTKKYYMNQREQVFTDTLDFIPMSYDINRYSLLSEVNDIASVKDEQALTAIMPSIVPSGGTLSLSVNSIDNSSIYYQIYNELGESLLDGVALLSDPVSNGIIDIKLPALSRGMYFIKINVNNSVETHKFIVN